MQTRYFQDQIEIAEGVCAAHVCKVYSGDITMGQNRPFVEGRYTWQDR